MKKIIIISSILLLSFRLMAFDDTLPASGSETLNSGAIHESCFPAKKPQKIGYQFQASNSVDFNIHYHHGKKVSYPIKRNHIKSSNGIFKPKSGQFYCMMWKNNNKESVKLTFSAKLN